MFATIKSTHYLFFPCTKYIQLVCGGVSIIVVVRKKHMRADACVLFASQIRQGAQQPLMYKSIRCFKQAQSSIAETVVGPPIAVGAPKCAPQFTKSPTYWMCSVFQCSATGAIGKRNYLQTKCLFCKVNYTKKMANVQSLVWIWIDLTWYFMCNIPLCVKALHCVHVQVHIGRTEIRLKQPPWRGRPCC